MMTLGVEAILIKLEALWTRLDTGHRNESISEKFEGFSNASVLCVDKLKGLTEIAD